MIPMPMADGNRLDFAQPNSEIGAVADEDRPFRPGIEQHGMPHVLGLRHELEAKAEVAHSSASPEITLAPAMTTLENSETANNVLLT
jgi:hypothetical protein